MLINPVTIRVSRHHLETLLEAAGTTAARNKARRIGTRADAIENAIDHIIDALNAQEK